MQRNNSPQSQANVPSRSSASPSPTPTAVLRGKTLVREAALSALRNGITATTTMLLKDLSGRTAFPVYTPGGGLDMPALQGAPSARPRVCNPPT